MNKHLKELPEGVYLGNRQLVNLTHEAIQKISELILREENKSFLRIKISGGGCNGLTYKMQFVDSPKKGDIAVPADDVIVLVDSKSALYLKGTTLDYSHKMIGGGFRFSNPNAKSGCSCGESFSI